MSTSVRTDQAEIDLERVSVFVEGLDHSEGVVVAPDGIVWAGGEAGQIYRIDPQKAEPEEVANTGGFALGLAFSPDGSWMAICDPKKHAVLRMDMKSLAIETIAEKVGDWQLKIPNYPVFSSNGTLYISESGDFGQTNGRVFAFDADGRGKLWAGKELSFANGMALDADESYLYVVESFLPGICRYRINADGSAGKREVYVDNVVDVPDGVAFDVEGNLYCSCYAPSRVYRIDPQRRISILVEDITCHMLSNCTNIAFGGPDFKTLFITNLGRWHIARVELSNAGLRLSCHGRS